MSDPRQLSAARLQEILDGMSEGVCRFKPDGTIVYVNAPYCRMFGKSASEIVGSTWAPVVHPDDLEHVRAEVARLGPETPEVVIENRVLLASGEVRWGQWTNRGTFDESGNLIEIQSACRDITERVRAEQELRASRERASFLAAASEALSSSLDYEETLARVARSAVPFLADFCVVTVLSAEGAFHRVTVAHVDPDRQRVLEQSQSELRPEESAPGVRALLDRLLRGERILFEDFTDAELERLGLDEARLRLWRDEKVCSFMLVPLAARGRTLGSVAFLSSSRHSGRRYGADDLALATDLGLRAGMAIDNAGLYADLREADRRKDEFLAMLSHELRNPLAAIVSALETLGATRSPAIRERALEIAKRQAGQQSRLVDDLLDVSRLMRGRIELRREIRDLRTALSAAAEAHRSSFEHRRQALELELPPGPVLASIDPTRLDQIVGNLLSNASKYTPPGGRIRLCLERAAAAQIRVIDEGAGLSGEEVARVFEPFVQLERRGGKSPEGLGLGLTLVRRLVELHGGAVTVRSEGHGRGSAFLVEIPLAAGPEEAGAEPETTEPLNGPRRRLLLVDDNRDAADVLGALLEAWGHEVRVVYDGRSAIEASRELAPDVALVDIGMPEMDGYETARGLLALEPGAPRVLVALTGYAQPADVAAARAAGFHHHVPKPVDAFRLRELLEGAD